MDKNYDIRWMAWDRMCYPKKFGGMGFKRVREFNIALLGKQVWRLLAVLQSFVARLLKARYFPSSLVLSAGLGNNPSFVWRSILAAKDLIEVGSILKVGNGESINIWNDPWIPEIGSTKILTNTMQGLEEEKVAGLLKTGM
ncbi:putative mitochondrial protein AtMg00310 [Apium graveolens]|uniref:putative mitochondrial protein AtMg00310 n=1 Tax=Apium graveolens TaxID=4045 RepID=UPI003D7B6F8D